MKLRLTDSLTFCRAFVWRFFFIARNEEKEKTKDKKRASGHLKPVSSKVKFLKKEEKKEKKDKEHRKNKKGKKKDKEDKKGKEKAGESEEEDEEEVPLLFSFSFSVFLPQCLCISRRMTATRTRPVAATLPLKGRVLRSTGRRHRRRFEGVVFLLALCFSHSRK